ncbi:unnamed protein product, partial [Polarella glacialis]
ALYLEETTPQDGSLQYWLRDLPGGLPSGEQIHSVATSHPSIFSVHGPVQGKMRGFVLHLVRPPSGFGGFCDHPDGQQDLHTEFLDEAAGIVLQGGWSLEGTIGQDRFIIA